MGKYKKLTKYRKKRSWNKAKRKYHDALVKKIDESPEELGIKKEEVVYKEKGPELGKKGRETIDNLILAEKETSYEIFLIEVKSGSWQGKRGMHQLNIAWRFFDSWILYSGQAEEKVESPRRY